MLRLRWKKSLEKNVDDAFKRDKTTIFNVLSSIRNGELKENDIKRVYRLGRNKKNYETIVNWVTEQIIKKFDYGEEKKYG